MARKLVSSIELAASPEAVWRAFLNLPDWPRWFPTLARIERTATTPPFSVGEELVLHLSFRGRGAPVRVKVLELGEQRVRWSGRSFGVIGDHAYYVQRIDDRRSRFVSEESFSGLPIHLIPRFVFAELQREHDAGMERFRQLVET